MGKQGECMIIELSGCYFIVGDDEIKKDDSIGRTICRRHNALAYWAMEKISQLRAIAHPPFEGSIEHHELLKRIEALEIEVEALRRK